MLEVLHSQGESHAMKPVRGTFRSRVSRTAHALAHPRYQKLGSTRYYGCRRRTIIDSIASEEGDDNRTSTKNYDTCNDHIDKELHSISYGANLRTCQLDQLTSNGRPKLCTVDFMATKVTTMATNATVIASACFLPSVMRCVSSLISSVSCSAGELVDCTGRWRTPDEEVCELGATPDTWDGSSVVL